jgi:hypothetical protein
VAVLFQVECFIFFSSHDLKCSNRIQLKTKFVNRQERNAWVRLPYRSDLISETLMTKSMESTLRPLVFAAKQSHHFRFSRRVAAHSIAFCNLMLAPLSSVVTQRTQLPSASRWPRTGSGTRRGRDARTDASLR